MKRLLIFGLLLLASPLLSPTAIFAQNITTVTATITDPNGYPYSNATVQAQLVPTGVTPTINGQMVSGFTQASADVTGAFSMNLASNAVLSPGGTQWQFTVNEQPGIPPPAGTGPQSFSIAITIGGASQNIGATLSAAAPALSNSTSNSGIVVDGVRYSQADIGAGINAAYAALPYNSVSSTGGGKIIVPPRFNGQCYNTSTPIVFSTVGKYTLLEGAGPAGGGDPSNPGGVCINYVPTTATTAITLDWGPAVNPSNPGGGIHNIALINNNCHTSAGCSSSAAGIKIGGINGGAPDGDFQNVVVGGFGTDWPDAGGGQSWGSIHYNVALLNGGTCLSFGTAEESSDWIGSKWVNCGTAIAIGSNAVGLKLYGGSIDGSTTAGITGCSGDTMNLDNVHFENLGVSSSAGVHYLNTGCNVNIFGGDALDDQASGADPGAWIVSTGVINISGTAFSSGGRVSAGAIAYSGGGTALVTNVTPSTLTLCPGLLANIICTQSAPGTTGFLHVPFLAVDGITNNQGIQAFNSTTTCTTAATAGAVCTTAAITLAAGYSDTNYRLSCTGIGPTNVPVVETYTKSNTTFTITIAALTAAAATFSSFDCTAHHN